MRPLLLLSFGSFVAVVSLAMRSLGADFAYSSCFSLLSLCWLIGGLALPSKGLRLVRAKRQ